MTVIGKRVNISVGYGLELLSECLFYVDDFSCEWLQKKTYPKKDLIVQINLFTSCSDEASLFAWRGSKCILLAWLTIDRRRQFLLGGSGGMLHWKMFEFWVLRNGVSLILSTNF